MCHTTCGTVIRSSSSSGFTASRTAAATAAGTILTFLVVSVNMATAQTNGTADINNNSNSNSTTNEEADEGDSVEDLSVALGKAMTLIVLGYFLRRLGAISAETVAGTGIFIGNVALPALLFLAMATLDFGQVNWTFVAALAVSRLFMFTAVLLGVRMVTRGPTALGTATLYAMLSTAGDDLAFGLPIVSTLYPPILVDFIYLNIAPALLVNAVAIVLLEVTTVKAGMRDSSSNAREEEEERRRQQQQQEQQHRVETTTATTDVATTAAAAAATNPTDGALQQPLHDGGSDKINYFRVAWASLTNPLTASTVIGIGFSLASGAQVPRYIDETMMLLGDCFTGAALFNCGASMVGKLGLLRGRRIIKPLLATFAKCILFPTLTYSVISLFGFTTLEYDGVKYNMPLFGFIMQAVPPATGTMVLAFHFGLHTDEVPGAVVLATALAAPLLFLTAQMAQVGVTPENAEAYRLTVNDTGAYASILSAMGAGWTVVLYVGLRLWRHAVHRFVLVVAVFLLIFHLSFATCLVEYAPPWDLVRYATLWVSIYGMRFHAIALGIAMAMYLARGERMVRRWSIWLMGAATLATITFSSLLLGVTDRPAGRGFNSAQCWFNILAEESHDASSIAMLVVVWLIFLSFLVVLRAIAKNKSKSDEIGGGGSSSSSASVAAGSDYEYGGGEDLGERLLRASEDPLNNDSALSSPAMTIAGAAAAAAATATSSTTADRTGITTNSASSAAAAAAYREVMQQHQKTKRKKADISALVFRVGLFLTLVMTSILLGALTATWLVADNTLEQSGVFVQVQILSVGIFGLLGLFMFLLFGAQRRMLVRVKRALRPYWRRLRACCGSDQRSLGGKLVTDYDYDAHELNSSQDLVVDYHEDEGQGEAEDYYGGGSYYYGMSFGGGGYDHHHRNQNTVVVQPARTRLLSDAQMDRPTRAVRAAFVRALPTFRSTCCRERRWGDMTYASAFYARDFVTFLIDQGIARDQSSAIDAGQRLLVSGCISRIDRMRSFTDAMILLQIAAYLDVRGANLPSSSAAATARVDNRGENELSSQHGDERFTL